MASALAGEPAVSRSGGPAAPVIVRGFVAGGSDRTLRLAGGAPVLTPYLFFASLRAKGDVKELLLGKVRARA